MGWVQVYTPICVTFASGDGQGHPPVSITMDTCPTMGCSVSQTDLAEVAARSWISVASNKEEVMPIASVTFDTGKASKLFAACFGSSRCGSHNVGYLGKHVRGPCPDCSYSDIPDKGNEDDDSNSNTGELLIDEMETAEVNVFDDGHAHEAHDQAEPVGVSKPIWCDNLFA